MKKLFLSLLVVAAVSFTACGGAAKTESAAETTATETTTETTTEVSSSNSVLADYKALLNKSFEISRKAMSGDVSSATEAVKLQEELTKFIEENKEAIASFTEAEVAEITKMSEDFAAEFAQ